MFAELRKIPTFVGYKYLYYLLSILCEHVAYHGYRKLLTLKNQKVVRTGTDDRLVLYTMMAADVYVILRIFAVVCLRL